MSGAWSAGNNPVGAGWGVDEGWGRLRRPGSSGIQPYKVLRKTNPV